MSEVVNKLDVSPLTVRIGAVIHGVDLTQPLAQNEVTEIRQALLDYGVIFFRNQAIDDDQMMAFTSNFAKPAPEPLASVKRGPDAPFVGTGDQGKVKHSTAIWHIDTTFVEQPPSLTILRAVKPRPCGGDTCWASMYAAYDALSEPIQKLVDGLTAVHSMAVVLERMGKEMAGNYTGNAQTYGAREFIHPLVHVHPETGRKALFYNEGWMTGIVGLSPIENERIVSLLREHVKSPEFMVRWKWEADDVAVWDNRSVQHFAVPDYEGERIMQRLVTEGWRPVGPTAS